MGKEKQMNETIKAFPGSKKATSRYLGLVNGEPCFEVVTPDIEDLGMDLRDYFAAKAMAAMITTAATPCLTGVGGLEERIAKASYVMADAMMGARKK